MPATNEETFVTDNLPYAQKVQEKYGIPVKVTLSQAAAESNWGKSVVGNNLFGIKGAGTNTTDAQTGATISQRKYDSKEHSFDDYGKFLTENKRYQPAFQHADTPEKFADAVASAGYSEKPEEYKQLLKGTMAKVDEVMGGKSEPKQQGGLTISPAASDLLQQTGNNPNEYLKKINADIAKGGEFKDKAYRSFYDLENKAMPLGQRTLQTFVSTAAKAPINQTDNSWWQDVAGATKNGINKGWAHFQEAFVAGKEKVGIDTSEEAKKRLDEIRKNSADAMVQLSPKAEQDIFNSDGINFRALSASTASGLSESAMIIVPSLLAGVATGFGATMAEIASATTAGTAGVIDMFGSAYEQGRQRGLTHEQAQTFGATVMPIGALMGFPAGSLLNKVMQPFAKAFTTEMVENVVEKGLTNEAFADTQKKATNGVLDYLAERGDRYVKTAAKESAIMGGTMGTMTALDQVAEKYYANNSGTQDKFKDVLSKTPLDEIKDIFKAAGSGALIGGIFSAPELFRPGQIQSIYGYIDKAAADPSKMENLKGYIGEVAKQNNYTPETTAEVLSKVDDMAKVATTYGKYVPSAEGRFQVYKLLQDRKLTEGQIGQIPEQLKAIGEELKDNPEMLKQKTETFAEVQKLLEDKQKLIDGFMGKIGTDKKPVEYKDYAEAANKLNGDIATKLKEIYPDANSGTDAELAGDKQEAPIVANPEPTGEKVDQNVPEPKTLTDLLDVPGVNYVGMKGMFNVDENGTLRFIRAEDGKVMPFDKTTAESLLKEPLDGIASVIDGYDKELYAQKVKGQEAPVETEAQKTLEPEVTKEIAADEVKTLKITPDEEVKTKLEAENEAIHTDIDNPDSKEEEDLLNGIGTRLENEGSLGKGQDTGDNKKPISDSTGQDSGAVAGQGEQDKTGTSEGTQDKSASTEQGQGEATDKGTGKVEKVSKVKDQKAEIKKSRSELLSKEPSTLREAIMQWFVGGGKVNTADIKRYLGTKGKAEWQDIIGMHRKGDNKSSADLIAKNVFGDWMRGKGVDEQTVINEIFDVLKTFGGKRSAMEAELRGAKEHEDFLNENGIDKKSYDRIAEQQQIEQDIKEELPEISDKTLEAATNIVESIPLSEEDNASIDKYLEQFTDKDGIIDWNKALAKADEVFNQETLPLTENATKRFNEIFDNEAEQRKYEQGVQPEKVVDSGSSKETVKPEADNPVGKTVTFNTIPEDDVVGTITAIDAKGNYKITAKDGIKHTVSPDKDNVRFQKESTSTGKPIEPATAKFFQKVVGKAFPGIKSALLDAAEFVKKHGDNVIAAVNRDGTIDINAAKVTNETQVHEMGHIWTSWAKKFAPEIYKQGLKLAEGETELLKRIKEAYPELKGDALHEEAMVTAIGQEGGKLTEGLKEPVTLTEKMKDWVSSMWNKLTNYVKNKLGVKDNRFDGLKDMGFNDFTAKVAKELISGKEISGLTSEEIAGIEKDGISRYQVAPVSNDTYMKATPGQQSVTVSPGGGGLTNKMNVSEALKIIGDEPTVTDAHIRDIAAHYSGKIHELDKMVNRDSKNGITLMAGMEGVRKLAEMTGTKPFNDAIKEIAEEAKRAGIPKDFDSSNLSKKARDVYGAIGQFEAIYDYRKETDGHLFTGVSEISHDAQGDQKKTSGAVEKTNKVYEKYRGKNPIQQKIFDVLKHYVTLASHLPLQIKMLSGGESPLWNSWKRSMQFAPGKEFRIKQNANDLLKPLLKQFGNGSNFLSGSNVKFLGKPLKNLEGVNWKEFSKESLNPDVKVTQGELLTMYLTMRDPRVREAAFGKDVVGIGEEAKSGVESFWLEEMKGERDGTQIDINEKTWNELQKHFEPHEKLINDTYGKAMDYTHSEEDPVFKTLNGINLAKLQPDANGNNVYFPLIYGKGKDAIQDFSKNSRAIGDVSSHKLRSPTDEKLHYGGDAFQIMNTRINTSADYAGFAVPIKNGDTMMGYAKPYLENNGMKKDLEYWNKWKETHSNGTGNMSDLEKTLYRGFTISAIGLNPFVNMKHLTTLPLATNVIRSKYLLSAIGELPKTYGNITKNYDVLRGDKKDWSPTVQRMMKSDFANLRIFGNTSELQAMLDGGGTVKVKSPFTDEMVEFKGKDALTDLKTWETSFGSVVWSAAEKMVGEESPHLKEGTPGHFNKVEELYMDAIVGAQPSFDDVHRSFISKGGFAKERGALNRALTIFSGQPVAQFNLFADRMISYMTNPSEANRNQFAKAFMNVFVMNALTIGTIDTLRQQAIGTQKQKQDGEWLANIEKSTYSSLPILAPLINTVVEKASGVPSAQLQYVALQTVNDGGTMLAHAVTGKEDQAINEMWNFGAKVIGIPATPVRAAKSLAQ